MFYFSFQISKIWYTLQENFPKSSANTYSVWAASSAHTLGFVPDRPIIFDHWQNNSHDPNLDILISIFCWCIWKERNARVFGKPTSHLDGLCRRISHLFNQYTGCSHSAPFRLRLPYRNPSPASSQCSSTDFPPGGA